MSHKLLTSNLNRLWSSLIIDELLKNHITHFYISPGMRNAPLIAALNHLKNFHPEMELIVGLDERSSSYRALGYAKSTLKPAVLICTSGTALANYFPAIIESFKSHIPLVIISADRPPELISCDENQTIDQNKIYGKFIKGELNLGPPSMEFSPRALTTSLSNLIYKSRFPECGPIHFNLPFRPPLEDDFSIELANHPSYLEEALAIANQRTPATRYWGNHLALSQVHLKNLYQKLTTAKNPLFIVGPTDLSIDKTIIKKFLECFSANTYFDVSSSLKYFYPIQKNEAVSALPSFDHPEIINSFKINPPDLILHIGGRITSKHYYAFLKESLNSELITLNHVIDKEDPAHLTAIRLHASIPETLQALTSEAHKNSWKRENKRSFSLDHFLQKKGEIIEKGQLSFPAISKSIIESIPEHSVLFLGNSTTVRSFDSYFSFTHKKDLLISTNRGVSGIEGHIATALGLIDGMKKECTLVLGDISFMYDLNSLFALTHLTSSPHALLKIIVVNNYGGGIFSLLPIHKEKDVLATITDTHNQTFSWVKDMANLTYIRAESKEQLAEGLHHLYQSKSHALLEIIIDNNTNQEIYQQLKTIK